MAFENAQHVGRMESSGSAIGAFLDEAWNGVSTRVQEHPKETIALALGTAAAAGLFVATRGRAAEFLAQSESSIGRGILSLGDRLGASDSTYQLARIAEKAQEKGANALFERAAVKGSADAQYKMFQLSFRKPDLASSWLEKAAVGGNSNAQLEFGHRLMNSGDTVGGLGMLTKSAAADNPGGLYSLGNVYRMGQGGVAADLEKAKELFGRAAVKGDLDSANWLSRILQAQHDVKFYSGTPGTDSWKAAQAELKYVFS